MAIIRSLLASLHELNRHISSWNCSSLAQYRRASKVNFGCCKQFRVSGKTGGFRCFVDALTNPFCSTQATELVSLTLGHSEGS